MSQLPRDHTPLRAAFRDAELPVATRARQWAVIESHVAPVKQPRRHPWRWAVWACAGAAIVATVAWRGLREQAVSLPANKMVAAERVLWPDTAERFQLSNGANVTLAAHTLLTVQDQNPGAIQVSVKRGIASFDVPRQAPGAFAITTTAAVMRVLGARFTVYVSEDGRTDPVRISVAEGVVQVMPRQAAAVELHAGQSWPPVAPPLSKAATRPARKAAIARLPIVTANEGDRLFQQGSEALVKDEPAVAARAFDELRRRFPRHSNASVAGFALGRLLLERMHDPRAASEVLSQTLAAAPHDPLREDMQARLVQALDESKQFDRCRVARGAYLQDHPDGRHVVAVRQRCGP